MTINLIPLLPKIIMPYMVLWKVLAFTPLDSDLTIEKVNTAKEIQEIQNYTCFVGQVNSTQKSTHQEKINPPNHYKMLGDFRNL